MLRQLRLDRWGAYMGVRVIRFFAFTTSLVNRYIVSSELLENASGPTSPCLSLTTP